MPSFYESLSMVTLEAWALGKPVLANAHCQVLRGQCRRSRAGLEFRDYAEFHEALSLLLDDGRLRQALGRQGAAYYQENYTWEVIEGKYLTVVNQLEEENRCPSISSPRP
jgi:glycosyltransferase involved in cell wall biosynthesis